MQEFAWVMGLVLVLLGIGIAAAVPWTVLMELGYDWMLAAASLGIPTELIYFTSLALALRHNGERPKGWYWRSFEHHHLLSRLQKQLILPWFYVGALSFLAIVLSMLVIGLAVVAAVRAA